MQIKKKHIITGVIAGVSLTCAYAYWQYTKLMDYCIGFKRIKVTTLNEKLLDLDIFLNLRNNSDIKLEILSQEYIAYINGKFVLKASNAVPQVIGPESLSEVAVNVKINPTEVFSILKLNIRDLLLNRENIKIKIDVKLKVKLWFITVNIPYVYESTLKEMTTPTPTTTAPKQSGKCK